LSQDAKDSFFKSIEKKEDIEFKNAKNDFFYRFLHKENHIVLGLFAKRGKKLVKPDKSLKEQEIADYTECYIAFNTNTNHEQDADSQTIYIQHKQNFASNTHKPLEKFVKNINLDISVNPINEQKDFWNIINSKKLNKLTLEVAPSNLFGHKNQLVEETDDAHKKFKAKKLITSIETDDKDGLNLQNPEQEFKDGLSYCMSGGGGVMAYSRGKQVYNSRDSVHISKKEIIIDADINIDNQDFYLKLVKQFFKS
jgi:hypothetical protein